MVRFDTSYGLKLWDDCRGGPEMARVAEKNVLDIVPWGIFAALHPPPMQQLLQLTAVLAEVGRKASPSSRDQGVS